MTLQQRHTIIAALRAAPQGPPDTLDAGRAGFATFMQHARIPGGIRTTDTTLGDRRAVLIEPSDDQQPGTILYLHGGAFIFGSPETAMSLTGNLVTRTRLRALSLDYRLAPEHPYPAAIDDALAAYQHLLDLGKRPESIVFVGDSAGGGIAIATCLAALRQGLPMPAAVIAFSPALDTTMSGSSMRTKADADPLFTREILEGPVELYLAGHDPNQELLSPALVGDLQGLPPVLLQAGTNEVLLDDSTRFAARARAAEVDVILDITAGVPHVFQMFAGALDEADRALDRAAHFALQHLR